MKNNKRFMINVQVYRKIRLKRIRGLVVETKVMIFKKKRRKKNIPSSTQKKILLGKCYNLKKIDIAFRLTQKTQKSLLNTKKMKKYIKSKFKMATMAKTLLNSSRSTRKTLKLKTLKLEKVVKIRTTIQINQKIALLCITPGETQDLASMGIEIRQE